MTTTRVYTPTGGARREVGAALRRRFRLDGSRRPNAGELGGEGRPWKRVNGGEAAVCFGRQKQLSSGGVAAGGGKGGGGEVVERCSFWVGLV